MNYGVPNGHVVINDVGLVPIKWMNVNSSIAGDNTVVAAVAGTKIRVIAIAIKATIGLTLSVKSGPNVKIDPTVMLANERLDFNAPPGFWVETNVGEALVFNNMLAGMQGMLNYVEL